MERQTQGMPPPAREPPEVAETLARHKEQVTEMDRQAGGQSVSWPVRPAGRGPWGCEGWLTPDLRARSPAGGTTLLAGPPCWRDRGRLQVPGQVAGLGLSDVLMWLSQTSCVCGREAWGAAAWLRLLGALGCP